MERDGQTKSQTGRRTTFDIKTEEVQTLKQRHIADAQLVNTHLCEYPDSHRTHTVSHTEHTASLTQNTQPLSHGQGTRQEEPNGVVWCVELNSRILLNVAQLQPKSNALNVAQFLTQQKQVV